MTDRTLERAVGARIVRSFEGLAPSPGLETDLRARRAAGVGLYRALNVESPEQVRSLAAALQAARPAGDPPVLVAIDQEGGQLQAIGDGATPWPGNLALGATGSAELARRAGEAIGRELAAVGVNVVWAPVCDLLVDGSVVMGTRAFGNDPAVAGRMASAMVGGIQSAGVAATIKHFPGHGGATADPHYELPIVDASAAEIRSRDLVPFREALRARPRLAMLGHLAAPALTGGRRTPATFSAAIARDLLRDELGFRGVTVSDALNMGALGPRDAVVEHVVRAAAGGLDLLLLLHGEDLERRATDALVEATVDGRVAAADARAANRRIRALRTWIGRRGSVRPSLDVLDSAEHRALAAEVAARSVTLVRDDGPALPIAPTDRPVLVVAPRPTDLTPADTTSYLRLRLAEALQARGVPAEPIEVPLDPSPSDVDGLRAAAAGRAVVVGTVDATVHPGQAALVRALLGRAASVVAVALRTPFDLCAYPSAPTYVCSYGIQPPTIAALADGLTGRRPFVGRLPVRLDLPKEAAA
jgi:beta-N-acetylhexosaminidase